MKKKELEKLKTKPKAELLEDLKNSRDRLWGLEVDLKSGKVKNVREIRKLRRTIATTHTILKEM